ncbi:hypothetical protein A7X87_05730 [Stenotrophomonas maltophilia]|nr:hypothetical protein A7X87_05730 [Stenotrophomonas maltophilia]
MQWGFDRVLGTSVGVTGSSDLNVITGQEVHGDAADFLIGVIRDGDDFAMSALLRQDFLLPS